MLSQKEIAPRIFDMWIATELAACAKAGQFIGVYPKDRSTLLPRPISICQVNDKKDALRIVYRIAGQGTAEFSSYQEGDGVEILGILGNGFPTEAAESKKVFLMGGGIGIPPMLELARELPASTEKQIIVGYRDDQLFLKEDLEKNGTVYAYRTKLSPRFSISLSSSFSMMFANNGERFPPCGVPTIESSYSSSIMIPLTRYFLTIEITSPSLIVLPMIVISLS